MKYILTSLISFLLIGSCFATSIEGNDSTTTFGREYKSSSFFRDRYQYDNLSHYLDNLDDYICYQSETTGEYNLPDQYIFSINGNSYRWNRYYLDGFRVDSRFSAGSTLYDVDLYSHSLELDYHNSGIYYTTDEAITPTASLRLNTGGLGGISWGTKELINLFHESASERTFKDIEYRNQVSFAASSRVNFNLPVGDKNYQQQLYVYGGQRMVTAWDQQGINLFYPEEYYKVQLNGELPMLELDFFDSIHYILHGSHRDNLYNELYYNYDETSMLNSFGGSLYGKRKREKSQYTTGITIASNDVAHQNANYSRNAVDHDGEAFDPWYSDGATTELSHAFNYSYEIKPWLHFTADTYNSAVHFNPSVNSFETALYKQLTLEEEHTPLYVYKWQSNAFWTGLLENTAGITARKQVTPWLLLNAQLDVTFDALLLDDEAVVSPNWQGDLGVRIEPCSWFSMELNLSRKRVAYTYEDAKYLSSDYLNGKIYYWQDTNNDKAWQSGEESSYFASTGGAYRSTNDDFQQMSYFMFDLPIYLEWGRHRISLLQNYNKYYNNWWTYYREDAESLGYYENNGTQDIFYLDGGKDVYYEVGTMPSELMESGVFTNSPYYLSQTTKYEYTSPKFYFSMSWQSIMMVGVSTLGSGPLHNNVGVLSESTANPNTLLLTDNADSDHKSVGRLDQDRAYVARIFASYQFNEHFNLGVNFKFKDGQPITRFDTNVTTDALGNNQLAMWQGRTKGINPFDDNFGTREDAFFNLDVRASYKGVLLNHGYELQLSCYNLYDFGTELHEYTFTDGIDQRDAMTLNIPRGMMLTATFNLNSNK